MLSPYEILDCSWPRPVVEVDRRWASEPEWDSPLTHLRPEPRWTSIDGHPCWMIDWREVFRGDRFFAGEMRRFHVRFAIRVNQRGRLLFWEDDGSFIRRAGELLHVDRDAHMLRRGEILVEAGDRLEIAQWQLDGAWSWGAAFADIGESEPLLEYREEVCRRLRTAEGPPLKIYCRGDHPLRVILAIYSLVLNGYVPSAIFLFGEHQWTHEVRARFAIALPFVTVVPTREVLENVLRFGGKKLVEMAKQFWFVMKSCVSLLCAPARFCLMDDDIVVLGRLDDGLESFREAEFVFAPDIQHEAHYLSIWGDIFGISNLRDTGALNTGFYWLRNPFDPEYIARRMLAGADKVSAQWAWEQGLFAHLFHQRSIWRLPSQRYFYPLLDGLPGGIEGYDYACNPCGFATVHFGGPVLKPGDETLHRLVPHILRRKPLPLASPNHDNRFAILTANQ